MKLVYIVGMGRSGSTLLDLLLDAHSNVRSLGGVRRLTNALCNGAHCACGARPRRTCEFWSEVERELHRRLGIGLDDLDVNATDPEIFRSHNTALFEAAAEVAGVDCVVDSSKSVSRLQRLLELTDMDVYPVHIHRDPRGYTQSQRKRKGEQLRPAFSYVGRTLRTYRLLRNRDHAVVEYARLSTETEDCLRQLMPRVGLGFEPEQLEWARAVHHNVGGGAVLKRTEGSTIRYDENWRESLPSATQMFINGVTWPARMANAAKARRWGV